MENLNFLYAGIEKIDSQLSGHPFEDGSSCLVRIHLTGIKRDEAVKIAQKIKSILPKAHIAGLPVSGVIFNGEIFEKESLISITRFQNTEISSKIIGVEKLSSKQVALTIKEFARDIEHGLCFLFADMMVHNANRIINSLGEEMPHFQFVGGVTGSLGEDGNVDTYVFDENGAHDKSVLVAMLSRQYLLSYTNAIIGHDKVGDVSKITKLIGDEILEIDGKNAVEWFKETLGVDSFEENNDWENSAKSDLLLRFPLVFEGEAISSRVVQYDNGKIRLYHDTTDEGQEFRLGFSNALKSVQEWQNVYSDISNLSVEVLICYSCVFRRIYLNNLSKWEMLPFHKQDISGAFMMGEFGTRDGKANYYNVTCSFLTLAQSDNVIVPDYEVLAQIMDFQDRNNKVIEMLGKENGNKSGGTTFYNQLIEKDKSVRERVLKTEDDGFKSMMDFLQDPEYNKTEKYCLVRPMFSGTYSGSQLINLFKSNLKYAKSVVEKMFPAEEIVMYKFDKGTFFVTAKPEMSETKFVANMGRLFDKIGTINLNEATIAKNSFALTTCAMNMQDMLAKLSEMTYEEEAKFLVCDSKETDIELLQKEFKIVAELKEIIQAKRIVPYFQGIYDNKENHFFCYEALMRLKNAEGRVLFPGEFMNISKKYGLYQELSKLMVCKVLDTFAERQETVSINISMLDILSKEFQDEIFDRLERLRNPDHFIFEFVETEEFGDIRKMQEFIRQVRQFGVKVALDDFGSGYSNFVEVGNMKIDYLKIDGGLVSLLGTDSSYDKVLDSILFLGKKMQVDLIAECVETTSMQKRLVAKGVRFSQGYLFSKPMPMEEMEIASHENKEKAKVQKEEKKTSDIGFWINENKVKQQSKALYWGGIFVALLSMISIFMFASFNQSAVNEMNDRFLVEMATNMADKISAVTDAAGTELKIMHNAVESNSTDKMGTLKQLGRGSFTGVFYYDGTTVACIEDGHLHEFESLYPEDGGANYINMLLSSSVKGEVGISAVILDKTSQAEYFVLYVPVYEAGVKDGLLMGAFQLSAPKVRTTEEDTGVFADLLDIQSFGGEAFYHICEIDGTPIVVSGDNSNLFQDNDMYKFIGTFDMLNDNTPASVKEDMENDIDVILKYRLQGTERTAVMVTIPGTEWCVISIILDKDTNSLATNISNNTIVFAIAIVVVFAVYIAFTQMTSRHSQRSLYKALESSYFLANSLQTSIETDSLTRAYSRNTATEKISDVVAQSQKDGSKHAMVVLDIDNFKLINDTYGHQTGDAYLQEFVSAVKAGLRNGDIIGRMGGDEFIILLCGAESEAEVSVVLEKVFGNVGNIKMRGVDLDNVTVSAGVTMIPVQGTNYDLLYHNADKALYVAKNQGKNKYSFYKSYK